MPARVAAFQTRAIARPRALAKHPAARRRASSTVQKRWLEGSTTSSASRAIARAASSEDGATTVAEYATSEPAAYDELGDDGEFDDEPTVNIPISFFSFLNLSPARAIPATIEASYAAAMSRELVDGFSDACLAARADLVDAAAQVLSDSALRTEHEGDLKAGRLTPVPTSQLAGALALMQEAGEHESVIEYAPRCLAAVKSKAARRDITLSAALAHCELSHVALTSSPPRVGEGCELLDIASSILIAEAGSGFSRELQDTIKRTLIELAPAYVIELLALPLDRVADRKEGLRALRTVVWAQGDAELMDRAAYVAEARSIYCTLVPVRPRSRCELHSLRTFSPPITPRFQSRQHTSTPHNSATDAFERHPDWWTLDPHQVNRHLTAAETAKMFVEAPDEVAPEADEVYGAALALVVAGMKDVKPQMIYDAGEMFQQLEDAAEYERSAREYDDAIAAQANAPGVFASEVPPPPPESVAVEKAVCQVLLGSVEEALYTLGLGFEQRGLGLADPQVETFVVEHSPSGDPAEGLCALVDRWIADVAFVSFRDTAKTAPPTVETWFENVAVTRYVDRLETSPALLKLLALTSSTASSAARVADDVAAAFRGSTVPGLRAGVSGDRSVVGTLRSHPTASNVAVGGAVVVGATLLAAGMSGGELFGGRASYRGGSSPGASAASAAATKPKVSPATTIRELGIQFAAATTNVLDGVGGAIPRGAAPEVTADVAEKIVRRWQSAKAQALGVAHNLRPLEQCLEGPMLQQWLTRAEDVRAHGWAWEYQLNDLVVDSVEIVSPTRAMVEATLTEVAVLKDRARTSEDDKYESTYRARYELRRTEERGGVRAWKIVGGSVVY